MTPLNSLISQIYLSQIWIFFVFRCFCVLFEPSVPLLLSLHYWCYCGRSYHVVLYSVCCFSLFLTVPSPLCIIQYGSSPLFWAAARNSKETAEVLLAAGANVDLVDQVLPSLS